MSSRYILSDYVDQAMAQAVYDKLEDGTFVARIPPCEGVIAFGQTLHKPGNAPERTRCLNSPREAQVE